MDSLITDIKLREILDSRGNPTIEACVVTQEGFIGVASVPSGASVGSKEAPEKRDNDPKRYNGLGVRKLIEKTREELYPKIVNIIPANQQIQLDSLLKSENDSEHNVKFGSNVTLAISIAAAKAAANYYDIPLYKYLGGIGANQYHKPKLMMNILNGGVHADNNLMIQEFMIIPNGIDNESDNGEISYNIRIGTEIYHTLKGILKQKNFSTNVGDEGGFAPNLNTAEEALELILESIVKAGYNPGKDVNIALDVAATEIYKSGKYELIKGQFSDINEVINYYKKLVDNYHVISIEDGMAENDLAGWKDLTNELGNKIHLIGDDLFVTNADLLAEYKDLGNGIIIKPNQIGTVFETIRTINYANSYKYSTVMSHRSGETEDNYIAHLAIGLGSNYIKTGAPCRADRTSKYNELIRIEESLSFS